MAPAETVQDRATWLKPGTASTFAGTGGNWLAITTATAAEVLAALVALPAYCAVMLWDPMARLLVVRLV